MQYSPKHKVCVYPTQAPERILNCVPGAKLVNGTTVAVPCTIPAMQTMRQLGYQALSPILNEYDWPIRPPFKPFDHQRKMAAFMTLHPRCFNLSDMGTGKTLSVLWALDFLMQEGIIRKALIITPLSTITRVWEDELFTNFMSRRDSGVLYGDRAKRISVLSQNHDTYIINHDGLGVGSARAGRAFSLGELAARIQGRDDIDCIIVDEGSAYKDSGTERYKVLRNCIRNKPYIWWLTGTPTPNSPLDAWSQARMVRTDYNEAFVSYRERTMAKITQFKWAPKPEGNRLAAEILQPAIRFERDECLDLPDVTIADRAVELSPKQKEAYEGIKKLLRATIGAGQINAINEAALRTKLIQIACGAVYDSEHIAHRVDSAPRLKVLEEIIEQASHKIIVFASLTSVVNMLYTELSKTYKCAKITGEVSRAARDRIFADFQSSDIPRIIVADPRTMSHGLTLTKASTTIWYGPTDKAEVYQQANKRMDRPGQVNKMLIVRLSATPIEREIYKRLDNRETMQGLVLKMAQGE